MYALNRYILRNWLHRPFDAPLLWRFWDMYSHETRRRGPCIPLREEVRRREEYDRGLLYTQLAFYSPCSAKKGKRERCMALNVIGVHYQRSRKLCCC